MRRSLPYLIPAVPAAPLIDRHASPYGVTYSVCAACGMPHDTRKADR